MSADDLTVGQQLHTSRCPLDPGLLAETGRLMGDASPTPLGFAFVVALRTTMEWGRLPGGAIMLRHQAVWYQPLRGEPEGPEDVVTHLAISFVGEPSSRYREVTMRYETLRDQVPLTTQEQTVLWPRSV